MKTQCLVAVSIVLVLAGCVAPRKEIYALNGSRADALLDVAFQGGAGYNAGDMATALNIASQRCKAWGYQGAEKFGSKRTSCLRGGYFGCSEAEQTVKYQCVVSAERDQSNAYVAPTVIPTGQQGGTQSFQSKQSQIDALAGLNLPYEEYQRRYKMIVSQPGY